MRAQNVDAQPAARDEEAAPFDMANLYPRDTGLPMTIWVSPRGRARHDVRIKVCTTPGDRMDPTNTAVMAVRPEPRLVHGDLPPEDVESVAKWIEANAEALVDYWDGRLSTVEFVHQLRKV
jgi:hypothetical protein